MKSKRKFIALMTKSLYVVWTLLLGAILSIIINMAYSYAEYTAKQEAIASVNKDMAYRKWISSHGGVYVSVNKRTQPNKYLANIKDRDFKAINKEFTLMNPAYALTQMMQDYSELYGVKTKITSTRLLNPANKADMWETVALDKIDKTRKNYTEVSSIGDKEFLRLMSPLVTTISCLKCHASQGYQVGDIRGGISVSVPMESLYNDAFKNSMLISGLFFIIWLIGAWSISFFTNKIYKYLNEKEELYEEYIYGLVSVVEKSDTYTAGHSTRVADYAEKIAKEMGFSEYDCHVIHRAGMLHDIGKVAIPDSVFLKPTKLSSREYSLIKEHVDIGYEMLKDISIFDEIKEIVRDHHEHYDGSGYPRGLIGEDTPMLAQILSLADSFDAMTTDRVYKGRKSVEDALKEMVSLSGKQFNPKIVQAALISLKDVIIDHEKQQNPKTLLEKERYSSFYKDLLTGVYNETYLRFNIHKLDKCSFAVRISLNNFHNYNKQNGWAKGDKVLQKIANSIMYSCKDDTRVYRFYGDNFLVLLDNQYEIGELKTNIDKIVKENNLMYKISVAALADIDTHTMESLEDVLKKLF